MHHIETSITITSSFVVFRVVSLPILSRGMHLSAVSPSEQESEVEEEHDDQVEAEMTMRKEESPETANRRKRLPLAMF